MRGSMKKGQILTGIVERVDFPNKGIVVTEEGNCIVKNVLPGQKVTFVVQKKRNGKAEGRLLHIEESSALETGSSCAHFGECGGCTYISLPYEEQLKIKEEQVKKLLDGALKNQTESWQFEGIKGSPTQRAYRNKMEFSTSPLIIHPSARSEFETLAPHKYEVGAELRTFVNIGRRGLVKSCVRAFSPSNCIEH